jgi:DNA repair protein RecN (Recombination protein N)
VLKFLSIQNIVLIDKAEINFASGLCILSGETGSGKSILLDALGLAIGFRSNLRLIGIDENKAQVIAEFDISQNQKCQKILSENDLLEGNSLRIRRLIQENSSSKVYINDIAVGVNLLSKIGESLIEIHGQHDQGSLLNPSSHIDILDEFSQNEFLLRDLQKNYISLKEVNEKIAEILAKKEQIIREKDYLEHTIKELENADIKANEEEDLITKKNHLNAKEKIINFTTELKSQLIEANSQLISSQRILIRNHNLIENFLDEDLANFTELNQKLDQQNIDLESAISDLEKVLRKINSEEENLEEIEERLFFIRSLARKYNVKTDELSEIIIQSEEKLKLISSEEEVGLELENQRISLVDEYKKLSTELTKKRQNSALILSQKVEEELQSLKMAGVKFKVEVNKNEGSEFNLKGNDKVRFIAAINNNNFDDISRIASGGELSRFMLALKVALIDVKSVPTMIFDEIDTGIGGSTADSVGKRLKILSKKLQVFVVTHQPQIAAKADIHFKISKISESQRIKTTITQLDETERREEIARMLSGEIISKEALAAAESLISAE